MNPLMMAMQGASAPANKIGQVASLMKMLQSGNPEQVFQQMMQNNPQFRQFVEQNKGKTPEQVAQEHGIDLSQFKNMM